MSTLPTKRIVWALALFMATVALSFSYVSGRRYVTAVRWVEHTLTVERALQSMLSALEDQESGIRGYIITGDRGFLDRVDAQAAAFELNLRKVRELVRDNPEQKARLERLEPIAREKIAFMATTRELRRRGAASEAAQLVSSRRGKVLMDQVHALVGEMGREETGLLARRSADASQTQSETLFAIGAGAVLVLVLLAGSLITMGRNAATMRTAAEQLAESEERYRVVVENVNDLVRMHAPDGRPFFVSPSVQALLGYTPDEYVAFQRFELVHPDDLEITKSMLLAFQDNTVDAAALTYRLRRSDGEYRWFEFSVSRVNDPDGKLRHYQSSGRDVTERRDLEQRLAEQAEELRNLSLRDGLTGLYNRRGFLELSAQVVRIAEREQRRLALLFVDLDGLKAINDRLGHERGDRAIVEAGEVLRSTCRATDLVARLGGDEFVVLARNVDDDAAIEVLTRRLERAVLEVNRAPGRDYELAFSLGVATFDPSAPLPIETLMAEADARMYEVKARRRSGAPAGRTAAAV
jgi:diguanylate cyclase (GGDEF)-like protein/PAS domain S-box-containing protein